MIRRQPLQVLEFANSTKREAATLALDDVGKLGIDRDTGLVYRLTAVAPSLEWTPFGDGGGGLPLCFQDRVTGDVNVTSATPIQLLVADAGAALGFTVPAQEAGTKLLITITGSMNNGGAGIGGSSDQAYILPVIDGTPVSAPPASAYCEGAQPTAISGQWLVTLGGSPTVVTFQVWSFSGNLIGCYPNNGGALYLKTSIQATGVVVQ